jgi:hypothetical protein
MIIRTTFSAMFHQFTFSFLCFRFSPEKNWYIDQMLKVLNKVKMLNVKSITAFLAVSLNLVWDISILLLS